MATRIRTISLADSCLAQQALALVAPDDPSAIAEGRLFVGARRIVNPSEPLEAGQSVTWRAPREPLGRSGAAPQLVFDRRGGIVAASKPASWSSEPDRTGSTTSLREHLSRQLRCEKLHIATRLDVGVSGLVLGALDASSRLHLSRVIAEGACHRSYVALVAGSLADRGTWQGSVESSREPKPRPAVTHFECVARTALDAPLSLGNARSVAVVTLLVLRPETGHRHQLRIHCSRANAPVLGDRRYGGPHRLVDSAGRVEQLDRIYLHAFATQLPLPHGKMWHPLCPWPTEFSDRWRRFGGSDLAFNGIKP